MGAIANKHGDRDQKHRGDDVSASQTEGSGNALHAGRQEGAGEDGEQDDGRDRAESEKDAVGSELGTTKEEGRDEERHRLVVAGREPELGGQVGVESRGVHRPHVLDRVSEIEAADEEAGNADDEEVVVRQKSAGVPANRKTAQATTIRRVSARPWKSL